MAIIAGLADSDYDYVKITSEKTPEELAILKSREEKFLEEGRIARQYLLDNPMKVDLGKQDVLFIWYYGSYYLLNKRINTLSSYGGLILKHQISLGASIIFDDKGILYKAKPHTNTFIQDYVNKNGSKKLLDQVIDLTNKDPKEAYEIMFQQENAVKTYLTYKDDYDHYCKSLI